MTTQRITDAVRADPLWVLLPLRGFLAFTFLYAGLSKIGDRSFLDSANPSSMHQTLLAVKGSSPIGGLLGPVADHSFAFGLLMALGETAVGIGMLLGLLTRIAALGGMVLALSLFLTVSWGAQPWYTGADIVYVFAFTPLLLAGAVPLSVDTWLADAARRHPGTSEDRTRRAVLAGSAVVAGAVAVGAASLFRGSAGSSTADASPTGSSTTGGSASTGSPTASAGGTELIAASAVPVGGGVSTKDPSSGDEVWVLQLEQGSFTAFDATCPHQGCAVAFVSQSDGFRCPCHQSTFNSAGQVTNGPATRGLTKIAVTESSGKILGS